MSVAAFVALTAGGAAHAADLAGLSLSQALTIANERNPDIRIAASMLRNAEASTLSASAAPNPTLTVQSVNINPHNGIGPGGLRDKNIDTTFQLSQVIERGGKRGLRRQAAQHQEAASQGDLSDTMRQTQLNVVHAYYDLLAAQDRARLADETAASFEQTLAAARLRKKSGDLAGSDVDRILVDAMKARNDVVQANADLRDAKSSLAQLLQTDAAAISATDQWPARETLRLPDATDALVERRPDVQAARARLDAALANRDLALANRSRDVTVGVQFEHFPSGDAAAGASANSYGISVQVPLFVRYRYEGEIAAAEAGIDNARAALDKTRNAARLDMEHSRADLQSSLAQLNNFQDGILIAAGRAADAADYSFKNGAASVLDLLDAQRTYHAIQLDALAAQASYAKALAAWRISTTGSIQK